MQLFKKAQDGVKSDGLLNLSICRRWQYDKNPVVIRVLERVILIARISSDKY